MNILKQLEDNQIILLLIPSEKYNEISLDVLKNVSNNSVCYVTLNKTYSSIQDNLNKKSIKTSNINFIDAISKTVTSSPKKSDNCYFIESPGALTDLGIAISTFLKAEPDYLVFDSLTNLIIYQKKAPVAKFVNNIINKVKKTNTKAIFYALKVNQHKELIQATSMFADKVIDLSKVK